jgi:hypothetical protein
LNRGGKRRSTISEPLEPADELSLAHLISFLLEGWKTIAAVTAVSTGLGLGVAFLLPEKFAASVLLKPAKVMGNPIEPPAMLAEKMRSPTYYSPATPQVCGYAEEKNPAQEFVNDLQPRVARQSAFVSVSIKGASPAQARQCIVAVMEDVKKDQSLQVAQQSAVARDRMKREEEKLAIAERFVSLPSSTLFRPPARCQRPQRVTDQVVSALKISISEKSCSGRIIDQP